MAGINVCGRFAFAWEVLQESKCSIEEYTIVTATDFALVLCGFGSSFGIKKPPKLMPRRGKKKNNEVWKVSRHPEAQK